MLVGKTFRHIFY
jgi:hypothetical protein